MSKLDINDKVVVKKDKIQFTGTIEIIKKWENPFSVFHKKGISYVVRADDDNQLYSVEKEYITKQ